MMKISNITKKFDNFALNISGEYAFDKKIYGIIGANGCGKTTLMKIMAGVTKADSGKVDYENLTPKDITMVFRKPYLMADNVYKNLIYPLSLRKTTPDPKKIEAYLNMTGLAGMEKQHAPSLSSGEQQKLAFARAMIFDPKLILIDEAFSNMDIESVAFFEEYILKKQKETPATWFIISHQLSNIKRLCDYVYFMDKGDIVAEGDVADMLQNPQNELLKKYLHYQGIGE
ncbi:MAG: ABC transporter ATP-binding protein [Defluviitaleaceae bacterium]|nr:ABC transporter ATP-binding protein [Defluviitaleaceae bacterium]